MALFNSLCLHDMLYGSLGVIKFDIELVVLYFFENLVLLLILKYFAHYLRLSLISILVCDMLWLVYLKEVVMFLSHIIFSIVFSAVSYTHLTLPTKRIV